MCISNKETVDRIKELSTKNGITMKYLCDCLGKRRGFLSEVRCGKDKIDEHELVVIADILHTTPEYLRGETDDPVVKEGSAFGGDPEREKIAKKIMSLSTEDLQKLEKILDMILEEK